MPQMKSAFKRLRQTKTRTAHNKAIKDNLDYQFRQFKKALSSSDKAKVEEWSTKLIKSIDKASQKGVLKKNTAARKKSRMMKKVNALGKTTPQTATKPEGKKE